MKIVEYMQLHNFDLLDMSRIIKCLELGGRIENIFDKPWAELHADYIRRLDELSHKRP
jgi:hypothetical protein